jgi:hypothetical protein
MIEANPFLAASRRDEFSIDIGHNSSLRDADKRGLLIDVDFSPNSKGQSLFDREKAAHSGPSGRPPRREFRIISGG